MLHGDDPLFHAIVSAHRDPDPRMARRFTPFSSAPYSRHVAVLLPLSERRPARRSAFALGLLGAPGLVRMPRVANALSSTFWAMLRPLHMVRARQTGPCCTPGCP